MCPVEGAYGESDDGSAAIWPVTAANHVPYSSSEDKGDDLSIWDIWHTVRNTCKYDMRLTIGMNAMYLQHSSSILLTLMIRLALTIPKTLPPSFIQSRWASEPVRLLDLPTTTFVPNKFKVDVLTKGHQRLIARFMRQKASPWLMISGAGQLPGLLGQEDSPKLHAVPVANGTTYEEDSLAKDPVDFGRPSAAEINFATLPPHQITPHLMYLREHIQRHQPARSQLEKYGAGFQDWPQSPLQPLADNLDSVTYEVFEKDPVKYAWYECAVKTALEDFHHNKWVDGQVIVAVVGAGRGPLVQRVLQASAATGIEVDCLALEKNPSAFVHLQKRNQFEWGGRVTLIQSDMRSWVGPMDANGQKQAIDILVSELLGSLGDNELSPECLDGVQHLLHPTNGISIPSSYSAFATPVSAPELWRSIKFRTLQGQDNSKHDPLMLPYVSWLHAADYSSTEQAQNRCNGSSDLQEQDKHHDEPGPIVKKLWDFQHPSPQEHLQTDTAKMNNHNERSAHHTFQVAHRGTCHGIAGYFDAVLYDRRSLDTTVADRNDPDSTFDRPADQPWPHNPAKPVISTNPLTMPTESPDMISWFPLFFPLKTPLYVPDGGEISISIWRKTDKRGVWYEWFAEVFGPSGKCGESICHSSESAACLM